jgi:hypothetical protein
MIMTCNFEIMFVVKWNNFFLDKSITFFRVAVLFKNIVTQTSFTVFKILTFYSKHMFGMKCRCVWHVYHVDKSIILLIGREQDFTKYCNAKLLLPFWRFQTWHLVGMQCRGVWHFFLVDRALMFGLEQDW